LRTSLSTSGRSRKISPVPETLQFGLEATLEDGAFHIRERLVFALQEEKVKAAVVLQHRGALRLRGMRGEHRLHRGAPQRLPNMLLFEAAVAEIFQVVEPKARLAFSTARIFRPAAHLVRGVLLHNIEELKHHGQGFTMPHREGRSIKRGAMIETAANKRGQLVFAVFLEHLAEEPADVVEVGRPLRETLVK
jgi:hypothetical protein